MVSRWIVYRTSPGSKAGMKPLVVPMVAEAMQKAFRMHGLESRRFLCAPDNRGARKIDRG